MDAPRLRKKRLVVIAGPSCSGKSWIIGGISSKTDAPFIKKIKGRCKIKRRVLSNRLCLASLRKNYGNGTLDQRLKRGGFLHFDITGRHQKLKRSILDQLIHHADQVIILNVVMGFDQWIAANSQRMCDEPERSISSFVKGMLKLHARDALAARQCYSYLFDHWQEHLAAYPIFRSIAVDSRQAEFVDLADRERLGLVEMTPLQLFWLRFRYMRLLSKLA